MKFFLSLEADFLILLRMAFSSGAVSSVADWKEVIRERVLSEIQGFFGEIDRQGRDEVTMFKEKNSEKVRLLLRRLGAPYIRVVS